LVAQLSRKPFSAFAQYDNLGSNELGPNEMLVRGAANSVTRFGEQFEAIFFNTFNREQLFGQVDGSAFLGSEGLKLAGYWGRGNSLPGGVLAGIGFMGNYTIAGLALSYPLIRSRRLNLSPDAACAGRAGTFTGRSPETAGSGRRQNCNSIPGSPMSRSWRSTIGSPCNFMAFTISAGFTISRRASSTRPSPPLASVEDDDVLPLQDRGNGPWQGLSAVARGVAQLADASAEQLAPMMQDDQPREVEAGGRPRQLIGGVEGADPQVKADLVLDADVAVAPPKAGKQHVKIV
jgi:hypothetical protein